jgi:hypothetical protein
MRRRAPPPEGTACRARTWLRCEAAASCAHRPAGVPIAIAHQHPNQPRLVWSARGSTVRAWRASVLWCVVCGAAMAVRVPVPGCLSVFGAAARADCRPRECALCPPIRCVGAVTERALAQGRGVRGRHVASRARVALAALGLDRVPLPGPCAARGGARAELGDRDRY